ncbi:hypothetical protein E3N88_43891 [Mikania micrantha]|uniref:Uncharacterized protein n=1 Tax=Mikania micrantha TaxID=192012 RepID=A0A5N6LDU1_9ASTR|nr:hypothetical protein E3N88_43891 [Mikania micrantha]
MLVPISNYKPRDSSTATAGEHQNHIKGQLVAVTFTKISTDYGSLFEVSGKYVPPIRPVGTGAYGIVWSSILCFDRCYYQSTCDLEIVELRWVDFDHVSICLVSDCQSNVDVTDLMNVFNLISQYSVFSSNS